MELELSSRAMDVAVVDMTRIAVKILLSHDAVHHFLDIKTWEDVRVRIWNGDGHYVRRRRWAAARLKENEK